MVSKTWEYILLGFQEQLGELCQNPSIVHIQHFGANLGGISCTISDSKIVKHENSKNFTGRKLWTFMRLQIKYYVYYCLFVVFFLLIKAY